jgi:hypothetical protein
MTQSNLVSLTMTQDEINALRELIDQLKARLLPYLTILSPEERQELPKMGNKTVSYVQKALEHCRQNPELVPQFLDVKELEVDVKAVEIIREMYQPLLQITEALSDTMILSGSEAFSSSLMFYNSIKSAMKSKIPKAETIYSDLSARFPGRVSKKESPVNGEATA